MKKVLFGILTFLGIGLSFCSADTIFIGNLFSVGVGDQGDFTITPGDSLVVSNDWTWAGESYYIPTYSDGVFYNNSPYSSLIFSSSVDFVFCSSDKYNAPFSIVYSDSSICSYDSNSNGDSYCCFSKNSNNSSWSSLTYRTYQTRRYSLFYSSGFSQGGGSSSSDITVYYNNGNSSESIECDGVQAIEIQGLSTITSTNTFTPYYNISYTDEDNQKLIESYSKDILYLENGQFKKTYTGNNDWILTYQGSSDSTFTGYVPVFDVSGSTQPIDTDYNMFNNFTDNSLKVLLSNIPGYIQYVFIIGIILLLLGIVKMFKRRK